MKKLILILVTIATINSYGQGRYFTLTKTGFISTEDATREFVVIPIEEKSQSELYRLILTKLNSMFVSPKDVLNVIENESISVNGLVKNKITDEMGKKYYLNYTITILFKDGRIRVDSPSINKLYSYGMNNDKVMYLNSGSDMFGQYFSSIWNKKGVLKEPTAKKQLEIYFDEFIDSLLIEVNKTEEW